MAYKLGMSGDTFKKIIAYRHTPPEEDIVDGVYTVGSPVAITAEVPYRMTFNDANLARHFMNGFNSSTGITRMYDFVNNIAIYDEFMDTPTIVALPNCWFKPSSANAGKCLIKMFVNETVPIEHDQAIVDYQGAVYEKMGDLFSYYLGDETGYQIKTKGIYFTFTFTHNGTLYANALYHYLT